MLPDIKKENSYQVSVKTKNLKDITRKDLSGPVIFFSGVLIGC